MLLTWPKGTILTGNPILTGASRRVAGLMQPSSGAWRHLLSLCTGRSVVRTTLGVVNDCGPSAVLCATAKGAEAT